MTSQSPCDPTGVGIFGWRPMRRPRENWPPFSITGSRRPTTETALKNRTVENDQKVLKKVLDRVGICCHWDARRTKDSSFFYHWNGSSAEMCIESEQWKTVWNRVLISTAILIRPSNWRRNGILQGETCISRFGMNYSRIISPFADIY